MRRFSLSRCCRIADGCLRKDSRRLFSLGDGPLWHTEAGGNEAHRISHIYTSTELHTGAFRQFDNRCLLVAVSWLLGQGRLVAELAELQPIGLFGIVHSGAMNLSYSIPDRLYAQKGPDSCLRRNYSGLEHKHREKYSQAAFVWMILWWSRRFANASFPMTLPNLFQFCTILQFFIFWKLQYSWNIQIIHDMFFDWWWPNYKYLKAFGKSLNQRFCY